MNKQTYDQAKISGDLEYSQILEPILMSFALCNNLRKKETEDGGFLYEGSSPDEIALGDFAREMNFYIDSRNEKNVSIINHKSKILNKNIIFHLLIEELMKFQILEVFPFESARKRMGIIIRNEETNVIE
jgi:phospholipid-translocating ATPase